MAEDIFIRSLPISSLLLPGNICGRLKSKKSKNMLKSPEKGTYSPKGTKIFLS